MNYSKNIDLDQICENFEPMHPRFEIKLLVNAFANHCCSDILSGRDLDFATQSFKEFLVTFFQQHHELPTDRFKLADESGELALSIEPSENRSNIRAVQKRYKKYKSYISR